MRVFFELLHAVGTMGEMELQSALDKLVDTELLYARGLARRFHAHLESEQVIFEEGISSRVPWG